MTPENRAPGGPTEPQPKKPRTLALAVTAGLGAIIALGFVGLLRSQDAPGPNVSSPPSSLQPSAQPSADATHAAKNPLQEGFSEPQLIFFAPDSSDALTRRTLPPKGDIPKDARAAREALSSQAVQALMQAAPDIFPAGTTLQSVSMDGGAAVLNFNTAFSKPAFWQGSALTKATMDALALTVAATKDQVPGDNSSGVRVAVDGKALPTLGEMDLSQPYTPSTTAPPGSEP